MTKNKMTSLSKEQKETLLNNMIFLELFIVKLHQLSREYYGPQFWDVAIQAFSLTELTLFKNYPYDDDFAHKIDLAFEELINIFYKGAENDFLS